MASIKNKRVYSEDSEYLKTLKEEYFNAGYDTSIEDGCLTVYALRRKKVKPKKEKAERDKRREKFAAREQ